MEQEQEVEVEALLGYHKAEVVVSALLGLHERVTAALTAQGLVLRPAQCTAATAITPATTAATTGAVTGINVDDDGGGSDGAAVDTTGCMYSQAGRQGQEQGRRVVHICLKCGGYVLALDQAALSALADSGLLSAPAAAAAGH